jgi:hypothetical protein
MMTVKPGWKPSALIPAGLLIVLCVGLGVAKLVIGQPDQAAIGFLTPVVVYLMILISGRNTWLEVTEDLVRADEGVWPLHSRAEAPRSSVRSIHYFGRRISFAGPDGKPVMIIKPNYSVRRMVKVAEGLQVPLYDHTQWLGMGSAKSARLAYDPAPRIPAA